MMQLVIETFLSSDCTRSARIILMGHMRIALSCLFTAAVALAQAPMGLNGYPIIYGAAKAGGNYMHNYYVPPQPSSTPWWPSWSPDGKFIAFAMHGSLWKVEVTSGIATEIVYSSKYVSSPDWSADGKWIIYTADDHAKNIGLEILDVETGETRPLTSDNQVYFDPTFSPDGKTVAYVSTKANGYFNIFIRPIANGQWTGPEQAVTTDNNYGRDRLYFSAWDFHTQPTWTPDGKQLLFTMNRGSALGAGDIWRMPAVADGGRDAIKIFGEQTLYRTRPHVSLDGKRFVYSSTAGSADQYNNLYVLPVAGGHPYKLTFGDYDHFHPRFSPDGEWIAYISNEGGLPWLWRIETYGGERKRVHLREMRWKRPMGKLHVKIADASGAPMAARIHLTASDGKFYAPATAYVRRGRSSMASIHSQGDEVFDVPPGPLEITAVRGFEFHPATEKIDVKASQLNTVTLRLKPLAGFDKSGWWGGSTHVHMNYAGNLHNTGDNLIRMAKSEGMDMIMHQVANKDNRILDHQYFAGPGENPVSFGDPLVKMHTGQEYRPPFYGHVFMLGLRDHLITPYTTGYEGTGIESLYPSNTDMLRKARAQGGVLGYVHAFYSDKDPLEGDLGIAKGFGVDLALKTFECLEWSGSNRASLTVLFHAWNNDFRVSPVGGEDSISSLHWTKLIGSVRTYVKSGTREIPAWLDGLRKGTTFMTTGPLLDFKVDGKLPGSDIRLPAGGGSVRFEALYASVPPLSKVVIYRNGKEWKTVPPSGLREAIPVTESGWYAMYAEGAPYALLDAEWPQALTNCIRVYVGDGKIRNKASAEYFIRWVDKLEGMGRAYPFWRSEREKAHVFAQFEEARKVYRALAAE